MFFNITHFGETIHVEVYIKEKEEICNGDMHMSTERNLGALVRDTILNFRILVNLQGGGTEEA